MERDMRYFTTLYLVLEVEKNGKLLQHLNYNTTYYNVPTYLHKF